MSGALGGDGAQWQPARVLPQEGEVFACLSGYTRRQRLTLLLLFMLMIAWRRFASDYAL